MKSTFYKIIANECFDLDLINKEILSDWSATYFQFSIEHALGYASDKQSKDNIICLTSFKLNDSSKMPIYEVKEPILSTNINGGEKAAIIKKLLGIPQEDKLMKKINGMLIMFDTPLELEIIISHDRVNELDLSWENLAQFLIKDHMLTHWRKYGDSEWIELSYDQKFNLRKIAAVLKN